MYNPSYVGGIGRRTVSKARPRQKCKTLSEKITKAKKEWDMAYLYGRIPAYQAKPRVPNFSPARKKKRKQWILK
jgi:hypothetical protein